MFFFFQAEDGIRDLTVTGVQTCALPILDAWADKSVRDRWLRDTSVKVRTATAPKSLRLGLADGSILAVGFLPKGKTKSSDRKSTRLNSSHSQISYAVFCLKKKK